MVIKSIYPLSLLALIATANAGVGTSGGGGAVVCRDANGNIRQAMLLDLYEGVVRDGLTMRAPLGSLDLEWTAYTQELRSIVGDERQVTESNLATFHEQFNEFYHFLPIGVKPEPTGDFGATVDVPSGCAIEQLAHYHDDTNIIDVDSEIWSALDSLNQGALDAHEVLYREYRQAGDQTSQNVRRLIARLFSTTPPGPESSGVPENANDCWATQDTGPQRSGDTEFYIYPDPDDSSQTVLQFTAILDRHTLGPIKISIPVVIRDENFWPEPDLIESIKSPSADLSAADESIDGEGLFAGYQIQITYEDSAPFKLSLESPKGEILGTATVYSCQPRGRAPVSCDGCSI
jgi:hypothetical protein